MNDENKTVLESGIVCGLEGCQIAVPTKSFSSTQWRLDRLAYLEESFGDYKALQQSMDSLVAEHPAEVPELINNIIYYIIESDSLEASLEEQIKALKERQQRFAKRSDNLRETVKKVFKTFDITKLECPLATISKVTKTASKLVVKDETELLMNHPELFVKQDPKLNKSLLTERLKAGETFEGATLEDSITIAIRK